MARTSVLLVVGILIGASGAILLTDAGPVQLDIETDGDSEVTQEPEDQAESSGSVSTTEEQTNEPSRSGDGINGTLLEREIHQEVNDVREENGVPELAYQTQLQKIARFHSDQMAEHDFFAHETPWGEDMGDRYRKHDYNCQVFDTSEGVHLSGAENLWTISGDILSGEGDLAEQAVESWMESAGHRKNLLLEDWENEGIGVSVSKDDGETVVYVTQNFC